MRIVLLDRLSDRVAAVERRAMQRNRERVRAGAGRPHRPNTPSGAAIWLLMLVWPLYESLTAAGGPEWWAVAGLLVFAGMHALVLVFRPHGYVPLMRYLVLPPFVALGLLLEYHFGSSSGYLMVVFPSQAAALVLPVMAPALLGVLTVTGLSMVVMAGVGEVGDLVGIGLAASLSGFVVCVLRRLFITIELLREARDDLATAAVAEERLRFSRDLHDLLGHTLSAIVVKAEVVRRLVRRDAARAAEAAGDIETIGRQALVEVREAVTGYRTSNLADELDGARAALSDAGIDARVHRESGPLSDRAEALLAWAVREATTNVIRHSGADRCDIRLDFHDGAAVLRVHDDGAGATAGHGTGTPDNAEATTAGSGPRAPGGAGTTTAGHGLRGMTERFTAVGGTVRAGPDGDGFTLIAAVAADAAESADRMCR